LNKFFDYPLSCTDKSISSNLSNPDLANRLKALEAIYRHYDQAHSKTDLACHAGCSTCCTRNVTLTSIEAIHILNGYENQHAILHSRLSNVMEEPRFIPAMTTNRLSELCHANQDVPDETLPETPLPCPFLENDRCLIYSVRPFACRCMNSFSSCHKTGFAEQSEWMVALNTLYLQLIEHLDCNGWSGNLIDLIWHLTVQPLDPEKSSRLLVKNRPIRTLVIPPEYRGRISPVIQELWGIISPAVSGNYPP
jgi:Fe-S-cluster containining protein